MEEENVETVVRLDGDESLKQMEDLIVAVSELTAHCLVMEARLSALEMKKKGRKGFST